MTTRQGTSHFPRYVQSHLIFLISCQVRDSGFRPYYANCISLVPILIGRHTVSHVDKSTAQWTKCMSPLNPALPTPTPAVRLSDTTRSLGLMLSGVTSKEEFLSFTLFSLFLDGQGLRPRPTARPSASAQASGELRAVHRGTDWRRQGGSGRGGVRCGDHMPRLTAPSEIHSREKIPAWHPDN